MGRNEWYTVYRWARMGRSYTEFGGAWRMPMLLAGIVVLRRKYGI